MPPVGVGVPQRTLAAQPSASHVQQVFQQVGYQNTQVGYCERSFLWSSRFKLWSLMWLHALLNALRVWYFAACFTAEGCRCRVHCTWRAGSCTRCVCSVTTRQLTRKQCRTDYEAPSNHDQPSDMLLLWHVSIGLVSPPASVIVHSFFSCRNSLSALLRLRKPPLSLWGWSASSMTLCL